MAFVAAAGVRAAPCQIGRGFDNTKFSHQSGARHIHSHSRAMDVRICHLGASSVFSASIIGAPAVGGTHKIHCRLPLLSMIDMEGSVLVPISLAR